MTAWRTLFLVFGAIVMSVGIGLTVAGGCMLWIDRSVTDEEGYLVTKTVRFDNESYAIAVEPADIDVGPVGVLDGGDVVHFTVKAVDEDASGSALRLLSLVGDDPGASTDMSLVVGARVPWLAEVGGGLVGGGCAGLCLGLISLTASLWGLLKLPHARRLGGVSPARLGLVPACVIWRNMHYPLRLLGLSVLAGRLRPANTDSTLRVGWLRS